MGMKPIIIGTRGSKLALYQAELVKYTIEKEFPEAIVEVKIISTKGDEVLDIALSKIGDKGLFTKELETELENGGVDMAVHSLKDLPTNLEANFSVGAVLERGDFRDAIISLNNLKLKDLTPNLTIATSSLRRKAGLLSINKDLNIIDIRGNVNTRIKKMEEGYCDAIIMAAAGLQRLGLDKYITEILEPTMMIPAVSQGVIAMEIRKNDAAIKEICARINHTPTENAASAERAFMNTLEGGCQIPVGCYTVVTNGIMRIIGFIASIDGKTYLKEEISGEIGIAEFMGIELAKKLLKQGGDKILKEIRMR